MSVTRENEHLPAVATRPFRLAAALAVCLAGAAPAAAQETPFRSGGDIRLGQPPAVSPVAVAVGDFDSNGGADVAVADAAGFVHVGPGDGSGAFVTSAFPTGVRPQEIAVADVDHDGVEDLVATSYALSTANVAVLRGRGDRTFEPRTTLDLGSPAHFIALADFDGDGDEDFAATTSEHVSVRLGTGAGTFVGGVDIPLTNPAGVAAGDFNGDGRDDLAVAEGSSPRRLAVMLGKGDGSFEPRKLTDLPGSFAFSVVAGDFDADAREDIAVSRPLEDRVSVRLGNGDGTFSADAPDVPAGDGPYGITVGDFDGDGRDDLVTAELDGDRLSIRLGNGDGTFRDGGAVAAGDGPRAVAAGDLDGDGRQDLAAANQPGGTVSLRLGAGTPPLAGNLLVNGGFEQGLAARLPSQSPAVPGWSRTGGMTFVRYGVTPRWGFPSHLDSPRFLTGGLNFLWGGDSTGLGGVTTASQTADVSASAEAIDAGRATANLSAHLGGARLYDDNMRGRAEFLDAAGTTLASFEIGPVAAADRRNLTTLVRRSGSARVPAGTRRIRVTLISTDVDTVSSAMADNVKLTLDAEAAEAPPPPPPPPPPPGGQQPSPPGPAGFGRRANVTVALASRRIGTRGPLRVRIANANAFGVTGVLSARTARAIRAGRRPRTVRLPGRRFAVGAGGRRTVRLTLPRSLRRELARRGRLVLTLSARVADPAGARRTVRRTVSSRLGRRR